MFSTTYTMEKRELKMWRKETSKLKTKENEHLLISQNIFKARGTLVICEFLKLTILSKFTFVRLCLKETRLIKIVLFCTSQRSCFCHMNTKIGTPLNDTNSVTNFMKLEKQNTVYILLFELGE